MYKVKLLNKISTTGLAQFPTNLYMMNESIEDPDAIIVRSQDMHREIISTSVQVIGRAGAGTNNIPVDALTKRGIPVLNTPGANANAVRELVIGGMLLASRHLCHAWQYVHSLQGTDESLSKQVEEHKKQFVGFELMGRTLGVIGLGSVGAKVANAAISLGMNVIGYDPGITVSRAWELSSNVQKARSIDELLAKSDFASIHVPLIAETQNLINQPRLQQMKPNSVLLNFSREGIIDNHAVLNALNEKKIAAFVTDFPNALLKNHPGVICLPHLGASTVEAEENCAIMIVKQIRDFLEHGAITNTVNFPTIDVSALTSGTRLAMANANVPNMVAQISEKLGAAKCNIVSLVNKSRNEIAYTLIDVDSDIKDDLLSDIQAIPGVMQARKIKPL